MKILIADFDAESRSRIRGALRTGAPGDTVWEAEDGEEAVCLARLHHPDLVMMAMAMPRIDGLEATRLIKKTNPEIRVIVMSVLTDPVYGRAAQLNGADEFLPKPSFTPESDLPGEGLPAGRPEGAPGAGQRRGSESAEQRWRLDLPRGLGDLQWGRR